MRTATSTRTLVLLLIGALIAAVSLVVGAGMATSKPGTPAITMQVSPASQSVQRGNSTTYTVTASSSNGFAGSVALSAAGLPSGSGTTFTPAPVTLTSGSSATSTLTVTTTTATPVGSYTLTITGTSGKVSASVTAGLTVNYPLSGSLSMTATPSSVTMTPGSVGVYTVTLSRSNIPSNVTMSVVSGLPAGASAAFAPNPTTGNSSTLQVTTSSTTAEGNYSLYLVASGVDAGGATRYAYANVQLVVNTTHNAFKITGNLDGLLAPGSAPQPLNLSVTNSDQKQLSVTNLSVTVQSVTRTPTAVSKGLACGVTDYAVAQYSGPYPLVVPGNSIRSLADLGVVPAQRPQVAMIDRPVNQDGCKGATLTLAYVGSGQGN
jgi:hypothetical protein